MYTYYITSHHVIVQCQIHVLPSRICRTASRSARGAWRARTPLPHPRRCLGSEHIYTHVCIYIYTHTCVYIYIYIYLYLYILHLHYIHNTMISYHINYIIQIGSEHTIRIHSFELEVRGAASLLVNV